MKGYDVIIIGGGVSGTSLLYTLTNYTDVKRMLLIEKHSAAGQVASHYTQNSQTLHFGDIETNYSFEKAQQVSQSVVLVKNYVEKIGKTEHIHALYHKMVIAVGADEVRQLRERHEKFKHLFAHLKLIERKEIARLEPNVIKGRDLNQPIVAMYSNEGYTIDYERLSKSFLKHSKSTKKREAKTLFNTVVQKLRKEGNTFVVSTNKGEFACSVLIVDAGAMSLRFAKMLGYGKHLLLLSVAGNFYRGPEVLNGKVYTMQNDKLPFAAVHGDPDVRAKGYTRYGPSAKVLFLLERYNYATFWDYLASFNFRPAGIASIITILADWTITRYLLKNTLYDLPFFGTRLFAKDVQKIVPTTNLRDIKKDKGYGGARPQIVDTRKRALTTGEARIAGENVIFNITPSPGASTCLQNARVDTKAIMAFFESRYRFDEQRFDHDLLCMKKQGTIDKPVAAPKYGHLMQ